MADEPTPSVVAEAEAVAAEATLAESSEPEVRRYTADDIRSMPIEDLLALAPSLDEHIDARADEVHRRELDRVLPIHREQWHQEQEETWLEYIERSYPQDYIKAKNQVKRARDARGMDSKAREASAQKLIDESVRLYVQPLANKLEALSPEDVTDLAKRTWSAGLDGLQEYMDAVQDRIIFRTAEKRLKDQEKLISATERKAGRSEVAEESPDIEGVHAAPVGEMTYERFRSLPLPERVRMRRERRSEYDALVAKIS